MKKDITRRRLFRNRLKEDMRDPAFRQEFEGQDTPVRLAIQIAKIREERGMTQAQLAKLVGTKQQVISRLEKGEQRNPTVDTLERIAHALGKKLELAFR